MHVDLDAARAARAEALGEHPTVTFKGRVYTLVHEAPWDSAVMWNEDKYPEFCALVFDDPAEATAFLDGHPSWADLRGVAVASGLVAPLPDKEPEGEQEPGEASAS